MYIHTYVRTFGISTSKYRFHRHAVSLGRRMERTLLHSGNKPTFSVHVVVEYQSLLKTYRPQR